MASQQTPQTLPSGQRFVQTNMVVRARHLTDADRQQFNIPTNAAADTIGIFNPSTGELINTMGSDQFRSFYHELDITGAPAAQGAQSSQAAAAPASQGGAPAAPASQGNQDSQAGGPAAAAPATQGSQGNQGQNAPQSAQAAPGGPNAAAGSHQG